MTPLEYIGWFMIGASLGFLWSWGRKHRRRARELEIQLAHAKKMLDYSHQQVELAQMIAKRWTEHQERQQP